MDFAPDVFDGMVYHFVLEFLKSLIRLERIGEKCGPGEYVLPDFRLQCLLFGIVNHLGADLAADGLRAALQYPHDGCFVLATRARNLFGPLVLVHIPGLPADESFVRFHLPRELVTECNAQSEPNAVIEEPCRLLGNADGPVNFVRTDTVFAVHNLPHGREPLVQTDGGIFITVPTLTENCAAG